MRLLKFINEEHAKAKLSHAAISYLDYGEPGIFHDCWDLIDAHNCSGSISLDYIEPTDSGVSAHITAKMYNSNAEKAWNVFIEGEISPETGHFITVPSIIWKESK